MAKEKDLGQKSDLTTSDFIRVVGSDNVSYKQGVANLFDKILKTFTSGSIAGKTQTIKSALDESINVPFAENGRLKYLSSTNTDFDTLTYEWVLARSTTNAPVASAYFYVHTIAYTKDSNGYVTTGKQIAFSYTATTEEVYIRRCSNGTWYAWQKMPTRAEVDELNSNLGGISFTKALATANTDKSFVIPNGYRGTLYTTASSSSCCGEYLLFATNAGAITNVAVKEASGITFTKSENTLTVNCTSTTTFVFLNADGKATA